MRLIDADALMEEVYNAYLDFNQRFTISTVIKLIKDAHVFGISTDDVTEIVRCKDCLYFSKSKTSCGKCGLRGDYIFTNDYCSYGVRRRKNNDTP